LSLIERHRRQELSGPRRTLSQLASSTKRLDWAAVTASNLKAGGAFEFDVYDPSSGISHVEVRIGQVQTLRSPAGEFKTFPVSYEIKKRTATESYRVFVSKEEPRILVREEFPDGTQSDLDSIAP
jgi:hypothetical protein